MNYEENLKYINFNGLEYTPEFEYVSSAKNFMERWCQQHELVYNSRGVNLYMKDARKYFYDNLNYLGAVVTLLKNGSIHTPIGGGYVFVVAELSSCARALYEGIDLYKKSIAEINMLAYTPDGIEGYTKFINIDKSYNL